MYIGKKMKMSELQLGDVVQVYDGPWGTAIVRKITDDSLEFFRPYGTTSDFSMGDRVICCTGIEIFSVFFPSSTEYFVYERKELK